MRILIVINGRNPRAVDAAQELAVWLGAAGHEVVMPPADATDAGLEGFSAPDGRIGEPSLVVALGGDGTILKAVHLLDGEQVPVLGVNLGRLGFLSTAEAAHMREAVTAALTGEAVVERRATLAAAIRLKSGEEGPRHALNDVFIGRGGVGRVIEVSIAVNGTHLADWVCDGLIVATPTGSTAYAMSAGGPIVSPSARGIVLVPVAPHTLSGRAFVLGPSDTLEVSFPNPNRSAACVMIDGSSVDCEDALVGVTVWTAEHDVLLVKGEERDFYSVVRSKLFGG